MMLIGRGMIPRTPHDDKRQRVPVRSRRGRATPYGWILLATAVITGLGKLLQPAFDLVTIALLYLLPVLISAARWGLWPSLAASLICILAFDFFFVPPVLSITVHDLRYLLSFAIFLLVALVTGTLASRLRYQALAASQRERRMTALYSLSHRLAAQTDLQGVLKTVVDTVTQTIGRDVAILMPSACETAPPLFVYSGVSEFRIDEKERGIIQWVLEHGQEAGPGTSTLGGTARLFVPVAEAERVLAVLALPAPSGRPLSPEQREDLYALTGLTALAITRIQLAEKAEQAKWLTESEKLHSALLNAVSHDLRTPLSSITGAVTGLLSDEACYDEETKRSLLSTIRVGALRMNRFVTNLLDMARLESGILKPNREWWDMEDIVGVALKEVSEMLPEHRLAVRLPEDLPPVHVDFGLMEQVLINLLENAAKYAPPDSRISIKASHDSTGVRVVIEDDGPPIAEAERDRIFDKFHRLRSSQYVTGSGLGLSICKGIVEAHAGRIWVEPGAGGGNAFVIALPSAVKQPGEHNATHEEK